MKPFKTTGKSGKQAHQGLVIKQPINLMFWQAMLEEGGGHSSILSTRGKVP